MIRTVLEIKDITPELPGIDIKYVCGRDNYSCHHCNQQLSLKEVCLACINPIGEYLSSNYTVSCSNCKNKTPSRIPLRSCPGRLIVVTGPMYSQKSTTTTALYNKNSVFNKARIWVKPDLDDRKDGYTETHDKAEISAVTISASRPDQHLEQLASHRVVVFDEVQFFSERIIYVIHQLLKQGANATPTPTVVIVNGLKLTASRDHFGMMPYLLAEADDILSLKSVCNICWGVDSATRTKSFNSNTPSVSTGGNTKFYVTCVVCDGSWYETEFLKKSLQKE